MVEKRKHFVQKNDLRRPRRPRFLLVLALLVGMQGAVFAGVCLFLLRRQQSLPLSASPVNALDHIIEHLTWWPGQALATGGLALFFLLLAWGIATLRGWAYWATVLVLGVYSIASLVPVLAALWQDPLQALSRLITGTLILLWLLWRLLRQDCRLAFFPDRQGPPPYRSPGREDGRWPLGRE